MTAPSMRTSPAAPIGIDGGGTFTNNGAVEATNGGTVSFAIASLTNFIGTTLTGGVLGCGRRAA